MKKVFKMAIIAIAAVTMSATTQAQTSAFAKGDNVVGMSIGVGGYWSKAYGLSWGSGIFRSPTFTLSYDNCIVGKLWDDKSTVGVGGQVGYSFIKWKDDDYMIHNVFVGVRGALHYTFVDKLDTYAGLMMGYKIVSSNVNHLKANSTFASDYYLGARYYFASNLAVFAEVGWYVSNFNVGIALKF